MVDKLCSKCDRCQLRFYFQDILSGLSYCLSDNKKCSDRLTIQNKYSIFVKQTRRFNVIILKGSIYI
jgi:hypothetical protein